MASSLQLNGLCPLTGSDHFGRKSGALSFRKPFIVRCSGDSSPDNFDTKAFRHRLTRSQNYYRKQRENTPDREIIETLKANGNEYSCGNVKVKLAEAYGFCMGVERAVQMAYGARKQFTDGKIWITNEIIHNPTVNKDYICDWRRWNRTMIKGSSVMI
ncbi:hypothetical protein V6N13_146023 [Hibiscus sabdariffa]